MNHTSNPKALYVQSPFGCWRQWRVCLRFEPEVVFCGPGFTKCWHVRCCWLSLLVVVHARFSSGAGRGCGGTLQSTGEGGLKQNARKLKYRKTNAHFPTEVILYFPSALGTDSAGMPGAAGLKNEMKIWSCNKCFFTALKSKPKECSQSTLPKPLHEPLVAQASKMIWENVFPIPIVFASQTLK